MSTVVEIENAIRQLPKTEFWKLAEWFDHEKTVSWEDQMDADAKAGKLDFLFEEGRASLADKTSVPWPVES
jgi:hypothetical protein